MHLCLQECHIERVSSEFIGGPLVSHEYISGTEIILVCQEVSNFRPPTSVSRLVVCCFFLFDCGIYI